MPVASATAEMSFSVLRRLKTYVRSTMKNDRLSFLGLIHTLTEILKWTCTKQWRCSYLLRHEGQILDNFKKFFSIKVIKIVLDSMLCETLKWPQIASLQNKIPNPLLSRIMACTLLSLSYAHGKSIGKKKNSHFRNMSIQICLIIHFYSGQKQMSAVNGATYQFTIHY